ncbi:transcriptional regulator family: Fungal Specific TF [Penicillium angulare]|uniref:transcriptional regulator family: Fungal Specific TF n=1 Tax=Penicillium angulare TaxID=116970 RepID=UPI0025414587|nr:transcriptional regulator family: Fungal Specific TF [Penicillium angulare]KAJ5263500.1 transcriptional regulator family: Fungal Specific TF [Penicillium angulare]
MLSLWRYDSKLSQTRCPDSRFIWNLASDTVYSELHLSPGIPTITAILLNIGGRPTTSMVGNGVQLGSAVSLCHSMGLNRNPLPWDIPEGEKSLRINVWWSVLIHDRWWVENVPIEVRKILTRGINLHIPGASNLRLSFLSVRLLLRRIELDRARQETNADNEMLSNSLIEARRSAEEIVTFVQELEESQLGDFWLPEVAFTFSSTVTFLIRCALETEQNPGGFAQSPSLQMANDFLSSLKSHQEKYGWDLADICLAQHSEIVEKLLTVLPSDIPLIGPGLESRQFLMTDMAFMDDIFPSIWDTLQSSM